MYSRSPSGLTAMPLVSVPMANTSTTAWVAVSSTDMTAPYMWVTNSLVPSGDSAILRGLLATGVVATTVLLAVSITDKLSLLAT